MAALLKQTCFVIVVSASLSIVNFGSSAVVEFHQCNHGHGHGHGYGHQHHHDHHHHELNEVASGGIAEEEDLARTRTTTTTSINMVKELRSSLVLQNVWDFSSSIKDFFSWES